jgi:hypothetical protein
MLPTRTRDPSPRSVRRQGKCCFVAGTVGVDHRHPVIARRNIKSGTLELMRGAGGDPKLQTGAVFRGYRRTRSKGRLRSPELDEVVRGEVGAANRDQSTNRTRGRRKSRDSRRSSGLGYLESALRLPIDRSRQNVGGGRKHRGEHCPEHAAHRREPLHSWKITHLDKGPSDLDKAPSIPINAAPRYLRSQVNDASISSAASAVAVIPRRSTLSRRSRFAFRGRPVSAAWRIACATWRAQAAYQAPSRAIARELAAGIVADYGRNTCCPLLHGRLRSLHCPLAIPRCRNGPGPSLWRRMVAVPRMMTKWGSGWRRPQASWNGGQPCNVMPGSTCRWNS